MSEALRSGHGGNVEAAAKVCGCDPKEIIDFSSNINICRPRVELKLTKKTVVPYADTDYKELKQTIGSVYGLFTNQIALCNGASSAIMTLFEHLKPQTCLLYAPIYGEYKKAARRYAQSVVLVNRFEAFADVPSKSTVVFVNPSTPDGQLYDMKPLLKTWMDKSCTIIIDESFLAFSDGKSVKKMLKSYKKLYIIQSLTKYYACAGVRVGAIFAHPESIARIELPAWNISSLDSTYMMQALFDSTHDDKSREKNAKSYEKLRKMLKKSPFFTKIYKSSANFILVRTKGKAAYLQEKLLEHKILVRECSNFDFLGDDHLRFAVKGKKALKKLKKALDALA